MDNRTPRGRCAAGVAVRREALRNPQQVTGGCIHGPLQLQQPTPEPGLQASRARTRQHARRPLATVASADHACHRGAVAVARLIVPTSREVLVCVWDICRKGPEQLGVRAGRVRLFERVTRLTMAQPQPSTRTPARTGAPRSEPRSLQTARCRAPLQKAHRPPTRLRLIWGDTPLFWNRNLLQVPAGARVRGAGVSLSACAGSPACRHAAPSCPAAELHARLIGPSPPPLSPVHDLPKPVSGGMWHSGLREGRGRLAAGFPVRTLRHPGGGYRR